MKKPSMTSFLIAFLLAAAVCTHGKAEDVKDSNGNPVKVHAKYFILTVNGRALVPAATHLIPFCPLGIVENVFNARGMPVSFITPHIIGDTTINTYSIVNIEFRRWIWPECNEFSKLWAVDDSSPSAKEPAIIIGGKTWSPNSWFKIEKATGAHTYKLTTSKGTGTVGTIPAAWLNAPQLHLTNDEAKTIFVKFVKADDDATTATTTTTSRVEKLGLRMLPFY